MSRQNTMAKYLAGESSRARARDVFARVCGLPVAFSVLSSLKFFGQARGHRLPGTWFVETLGSFGVAANTVRQALYRLERQHVLTGDKIGRTKVYSMASPAEAAVDVGASKLFREGTEQAWDGMWTVVNVAIGSDQRYEQNRILDVLRVEGFAHLADGMFVHPRPRTDKVLAAARDLHVEDGITAFRGYRTDNDDSRVMVALWDLAVVRLKYDRFCTTYDRFTSERAGVEDPRVAYARRMLLVHDFLSAAWEDPDLPRELQPDDWPADRARRVARVLLERWTPAALAYGDEVLARVANTG